MASLGGGLPDGEFSSGASPDTGNGRAHREVPPLAEVANGRPLPGGALRARAPDTSGVRVLHRGRFRGGTWCPGPLRAGGRF